MERTESKPAFSQIVDRHPVQILRYMTAAHIHAVRAAWVIITFLPTTVRRMISTLVFWNHCLDA